MRIVGGGEQEIGLNDLRGTSAEPKGLWSTEKSNAMRSSRLAVLAWLSM